MNQYTYALGATQISVGTSGVFSVDLTKSPGCLGAFLKINSAGTSGAIWILPGAGGTTGDGYKMEAGEVLDIKGPAAFYLRAGLNSVDVGIALKLTAGVSIIA